MKVVKMSSELFKTIEKLKQKDKIIKKFMIENQQLKNELNTYKCNCVDVLNLESKKREFKLVKKERFINGK